MKRLHIGASNMTVLSHIIENFKPDHCLNHIRQIIQCHMDLTPVTSIRFESVDTSVGNFDQVHTCRDLGNLREWMVERSSLNVRESGSNASRHGYIINEEALLPWDWTESEFE